MNWFYLAVAVVSEVFGTSAFEDPAVLRGSCHRS